MTFTGHIVIAATPGRPIETWAQPKFDGRTTLVADHNVGMSICKFANWTLVLWSGRERVGATWTTFDRVKRVE